MFTDRGDLKYPSLTLANRMWNIYLYFRKVFPQIRTSSKIVDDWVEFIVPCLSKCKELQCSYDGRHCNLLCSVLCQTFFLALLLHFVVFPTTVFVLQQLTLNLSHE